jgi:hypothetical protein
VGLVLRAVPPGRFEVSRFLGKGNAPIAQEKVVVPPGVGQRQGVFAKNARVGCQPQEAQLRETAKETDGARRQAIEPRFRCRVMCVRVEGKREPDVNVGEQHHLRP